MKIFKIKTIGAQWLGTVSEGKRLEIFAVGEDGKELKDVDNPLATILANEDDESLLIELYTETGTVQIPLSELNRVFEMARSEVHSESWYEENVYKDDETT